MLLQNIYVPRKDESCVGAHFIIQNRSQLKPEGLKNEGLNISPHPRIRRVLHTRENDKVSKCTYIYVFIYLCIYLFMTDC